MARQDLGHCDCPICGMSGAHVREAEGKNGKPGKAYIVCEECTVQIFSRSRVGEDSDKLIRAAVRPVIEGAAVQEPGRKKDEPSEAGRAQESAGVIPVVEPPPIEKKPAQEDVTIFDAFPRWLVGGEK